MRPTVIKSIKLSRDQAYYLDSLSRCSWLVLMRGIITDHLHLLCFSLVRM